MNVSRYVSEEFAEFCRVLEEKPEKVTIWRAEDNSAIVHFRFGSVLPPKRVKT